MPTMLQTSALVVNPGPYKKSAMTLHKVLARTLTYQRAHHLS
jgi:hypothetical protein